MIYISKINKQQLVLFDLTKLNLNIILRIFSFLLVQLDIYLHFIYAFVLITPPINERNHRNHKKGKFILLDLSGNFLDCQANKTVFLNNKDKASSIFIIKVKDH